MPLHYAAAQGRSPEVMVLLLDANFEAATIPAEVRHRAHRAYRPAPLRPVALRAPRPPRSTSTNLASSCAAQGGLLPLHLAIMQGAAEEVVTLLLDANSEATATPDEARTLNL